MKVIEPSYEFITPLNDIGLDTILKRIEYIARTCYKSEDKIDPTSTDSAKKLISNLIHNGHEAMIEHVVISFKWICDRGVTHELVRHRLASFAQESSRYCSYDKDKFGNEITVIKPLFWEEDSTDYKLWYELCLKAEETYMKLLANGCKAQEARDVLPNSLKTEIVVTMNLRELRHFLRLRSESYAHPQMRQLAVPMLKELDQKLPILFDDIVDKVKESYPKDYKDPYGIWN